MDSDDQTDADFFDKLIDDDEPGAVSSTSLADDDEPGAVSSTSLADDDEPGGTVPEGKSPATGEGTGVHTGLAIAQVPEAATLPRDFSSSSLADGNEPGATDPPVPDGGLPASGKGTGVHTGLANAQVPEIATLPRGFSSNSHPDHEEPGATDPPVPYGGSPGSGKGTGVHTAVKQAQWTSFGGDDNESDPFADLAGTDGFLGNMAGLDISAAGTSGASDHAALTTAVTDQDFFGSNTHHNTADGELELSSSTGAVDSTDPKYLEAMYPGWKYDEATQQWYQVDGLDTSGNAQQPHDASHLQNSALGIIAEEGATTATVSSWAASEYPPNMLFYAEYPGWYFDTNTQQWHSLESYQQAAMQPGTASALQNGTIYNVTAASTAMDYSAYQTENSEVSQQNSSTNSYAHQSQGQADAFANTMQYDAATDGSVTSSFYGFGQQANAGSVSASTSHQDGLYQVHDHHKGLETSSLQSGYNSTDSQQSSYNAFDPSAAFQASYKAFEPATSNQTRQKVFEPSTTNRGGYKAFQPSLGNQSDYKAFEPSTANHAGYKGFMPSTVSQTGYKESESYKGFETSSVQHAGYIATQSSSGQLSGYTGFETSTNHGYTDQNSYLGAEKQANEYQGGHLSNSYLGTENSMNFTQEQFFGAHASQMQFSPSPYEGRSSAGRPPHAIVSFGFGGKLIVMKESSSMAANFNSGNQGNSSGTVSLLNLSEVVDKAALASSTKSGVFSYFQALCRQPVPGPLVGGSAASKDVNKWLDEMIAWYGSSSNDFQRPDTRKLLISLLKILCQHYGKLRSPFGSDPQEESNGPEMAVTKLFSSCKKSRIHMGNYGSIVHCMKNIPAESQIQAVAQEVQSLLVSGRRKEALQCAQGGQLWGPAIILALQLGDQFYVDTVKKMAHSHFVAGSPLRTLCLLIAGQPADVFTADNNINSDYTTLGASHQSLESGPNGMLNDWEENLAIITANRTKGDDLVITHLGDCLWKERYEVVAAHSCYLVAELNIDSYSESARLCLIGADHLKCPRTYVSPEAIQRTEVYEHAKVLGNSQYILLPFQPYKLIYAYMLVEVGRISDSLRYCQASMKVLKASGRAPELETWKQLFSSLEERIRTHQQGGYGTNLGPAKLVGKIFPSLDKSISRMMGTQSAPLPPLVQGSISDRESYFAPAAAKFGNNQSVMAVSSLIPSASTQSMSEIAENSNGGPGSKVTHNRSVSEPDFGRTPKQGTGSDSTQSNASGSGSSRFGWLGSTLQKTMGLVSKSHRQAKLGEQNKFYYDEKLKRWVEEGAAIPAEEPPLPPPPSRSSFQNGLPDQKLNGPMSGSHAPNGIAEWRSSNSSEHGSGMPPIPPSQNQFSARGRMGVRSRYVDTFNKTGASGAMPSYNKPAAPSAVPPAGAKFFMPTAVSASEDQLSHEASEVHSETVHLDERSASPPAETSFSSPLPSAQSSEPVSSTIHRHPSMDSISTPYQGSGVSAESGSSSFSRSRAASWSGTYSEPFSASAGARSPDGQTMPVPVMPGQRPPPSRSNSSSSAQLNGLTEDLHEVEL